MIVVAGGRWQVAGGRWQVAGGRRFGERTMLEMHGIDLGWLRRRCRWFPAAEWEMLLRLAGPDPHWLKVAHMATLMRVTPEAIRVASTAVETGAHASIHAGDGGYELSLSWDDGEVSIPLPVADYLWGRVAEVDDESFMIGWPADTGQDIGYEYRVRRHGAKMLIDVGVQLSADVGVSLTDLRAAVQRSRSVVRTSVAVNEEKRMKGDNESLPVEVASGLDQLQVDEGLRSLVAALAEQRSVTADPPISGYLGVRPSMHGTISVYVHATYADFALDPERVRSVYEHHGWKIVKTNPTTGILRATASAIADSDDSYELALALACEAIDKSEAGPAYEGGQAAGQRAGREPDVCLVHHEVKLGGVCAQCPD